jgi:hypothetical protein
MKIRERKYELSLLTEIFLGKMSSIFFFHYHSGNLYGIGIGRSAVYSATRLQ